GLGDTAQGLSPVGGLGSTLAGQDAVAAANRLVDPLRAGTLSDRDLADVQRRRMFPTRATQRLQIFIHEKFLSRMLASRQSPSPPWPARLLGRFPLLQRIPARLI